MRDADRARSVVVGPRSHNNARLLGDLVIAPEEGNLTRQRAELEQGFAAVARYAVSRDRPVFVGEFGTSDNADMASRVRWTRFNRELAEAHGCVVAPSPTHDPYPT